MFRTLSPTEWISVISLSLGLAALLVRFLIGEERATAKLHLLITVIVLVAVSGTVAAANSLIWATTVNALTGRIYHVIGNQEKTTEQILLELGPVEAKSFAAALDLLQERHRVESRVAQATLSGDRQALVRLWRALPE